MKLIDWIKSELKSRERTDDCWVWDRGTVAGYGYCARGHAECYAHRIVYHEEHGKIEPGLVVRHTCDNTRCWNPRHLLIGTQADNDRDMVQRGRDQWAGRTHCARGHLLTEDNWVIGKHGRQCGACLALTRPVKIGGVTV